MKYYNYLTFLLLGVSALLASCSDDNSGTNSGPKEIVINTEKIIGEWVGASSDGNQFSKMVLESDGGFNISKVENGWNVASANRKGKWIASNNVVSGTYTKMNGAEDPTGEPVIVNITLSEQENYSFTAISSDNIPTEYKKLIGEVNIRRGQTVIPECLDGMNETTVKTIVTPFQIRHETVTSSKIKNLKSQNSAIATVDASTGAVTAISNGVTFVDVETSEGTATIKVVVDDNFLGLMGKSRAEIHEIYGTENIAFEDISQILYNMEGDFKFLKIQFMQGIVYAVAVYSKDNIFVDADLYKKNFETEYYVFEKGTSTNYLAYTNAPSLEESKYGIIFDYTASNSFKIYYLDLSKEVLFHDYSVGLGKTKTEIFDMYGTRTEINTTELVYYKLRDGYNSYVDEVIFKFESESEKCSAVGVNFQKNANVTEIKNWLSNTMDHVKTKGDLSLYYSKDREVELLYNAADNSLLYKYNDLWENYISLFGMSDNDVNRTMVGTYGAKYAMSDYSYSVNGSDYYYIYDSDVAFWVGFVFNAQNKMCEYWAYLNSDYDVIQVKKFLGRYYEIAEDECTNRQLIYYSADKRIKVIFDASGYVAYIDSEQERHVEPSLAKSMSDIKLPRPNK